MSDILSESHAGHFPHDTSGEVLVDRTIFARAYLNHRVPADDMILPP